MSYIRPASNVAVADDQTSGTAGIQSHGTGVARVLPISSLRFVLALCVVIGHFGLPIGPLNEMPSRARTAHRNLLCGGVIVFFVISGFCIHFPNRNGLAVKSWRMYFARRYLRILIPMSVAIALSVPLKMQFGLLSYSILWSLLCSSHATGSAGAT
jgi:peptidoglycan/LPS O-acetylase OafA/YrhL